jgi:hypothetical protein
MNTEMLSRLCSISILLLISTPLWCQVEPSASGGEGAINEDSPMPLSPQVSGSFYPSSVDSHGRSNILSGGIVFIAAYNDNLLTGGAAKPIGAESYSILPTIRLDQSTSRTHGSLSYSPGFTFYEPVTALNGVMQNAIADFQYRLTPRLTFSGQEFFEQNSSAFSQPYSYAGATVSGSNDVGSPILIVPYLGQIVNSASGTIGYQFSRNGMIGGGGSYSIFDFSGQTQQTGLYNSGTAGGSAFYSRRLTETQFIGVRYRFYRTVTDSTGTIANPGAATTQTQAGSVFYTVSFPNRLSLSLSGGPVYESTTYPGTPTSNTWGPGGTASIGWQRTRTNLAMSYSRAITSGQGFLGAYTTDNANLSAQWLFTPRLTGGLSGSYSNVKNSTPLVGPGNPTGHTLFGRASLQYAISEHMGVIGEYTRLHQNYSGIGEIANDPNADRVSVTLNYSFTRPLGQ